MFALLLRINKVNHAHPAQHQRISDQTAMAVFRQMLGAHYRGRPALCEI